MVFSPFGSRKSDKTLEKTPEKTSEKTFVDTTNEGSPFRGDNPPDFAAENPFGFNQQPFSTEQTHQSAYSESSSLIEAEQGYYEPYQTEPAAPFYDSSSLDFTDQNYSQNHGDETLYNSALEAPFDSHGYAQAAYGLPQQTNDEAQRDPNNPFQPSVFQQSSVTPPIEAEVYGTAVYQQPSPLFAEQVPASVAEPNPTPPVTSTEFGVNSTQINNASSQFLETPSDFTSPQGIKPPVTPQAMPRLRRPSRLLKPKTSDLPPSPQIVPAQVSDLPQEEHLPAFKLEAPTEPAPDVLIAQGVGKSFGKRIVLFDVSLALRRGEVIGLLGPNGAGKTTCFYIVCGLIRADRGLVHLNGKNITRLPMYRRARMGLGYLPQEASIFRGMTVEQNIMAVLQAVEPRRNRRRQRLEQLIEEFSIGHIQRSPALALSGGERRRVEIARALAADPSFILLDEPFAGIDPIAVGDIRKLVSQLKNRGIGVLITDHNVRETLGVVDRAYIIYGGRVLQHGTPDDIVADERVRQVYLGEQFSL